MFVPEMNLLCNRPVLLKILLSLLLSADIRIRTVTSMLPAKS